MRGSNAVVTSRETQDESLLCKKKARMYSSVRASNTKTEKAALLERRAQVRGPGGARLLLRQREGGHFHEQREQDDGEPVRVGHMQRVQPFVQHLEIPLRVSGNAAGCMKDALAKHDRWVAAYQVHSGKVVS